MIDYRTRAGRESEVLAEVEIAGRLNAFWISDNIKRAHAVDRLIRAGKLKYLPGGTYPWVRYEIVPERPQRIMPQQARHWVSRVLGVFP